MKHLIILILSLCSITAAAQTATTPPAGSKPYGTPVATPTGEILVGRNGSYTYITPLKYTDSLIALGYSRTQVDSAITSRNYIARNSVKPSDLGYNAGGANRVPIFSSTGDAWQSSIPVTASVQASSIALRHVSGRLRIGNASENDEAVTLRQLKDSVNAIPTNQIFQACVVRYNSSLGEWEIIDDGTHAPLNIDSVTNATNAAYNFTVWYSHVAEVGSVTGAVDESYATLGLFVGASVGSAQAHFRITSKGLYVKAFYDGDSWELDSSAYNPVLPQAISISFDNGTGNLTISHAGINVLNDFLSLQTSGPYTVSEVSKSLSQTVVRFLDSSGNPVLTPDTNMTVDLYRNGVYYIPNFAIRSTTPVGATNIWIQGIHRKLE